MQEGFGTVLLQFDPKVALKAGLQWMSGWKMT